MLTRQEHTANKGGFSTPTANPNCRNLYVNNTTEFFTSGEICGFSAVVACAVVRLAFCMRATVTGSGR